MSQKDEKKTNAPAPEDDFSLEDILAEYGGSLEHQLLRGAETKAKPKANSPLEKGSEAAEEEPLEAPEEKKEEARREKQDCLYGHGQIPDGPVIRKGDRAADLGREGDHDAIQRRFYQGRL